jgi:hypothetical protein
MLAAALVAYLFTHRGEGDEQGSGTPVVPSAAHITDGPGEELFPSLSPEGKSVIYVAGAWAIWTSTFKGWEAKIRLT